MELNFRLDTIPLESLFEGNQSYSKQYPALIKLGQKCDDSQDYLALALAVYGWMPTILKHEKLEELALANLRTLSRSDAIAYLNENLDGAPINNSWVGTSKFLHMLNPSVFPIWDSKIASAFGLKSRHSYEKKSVYIAYTTYCHRAIGDHQEILRRFAIEMQSRFEYSPTPIRCLESLIFLQVQKAKN